MANNNFFRIGSALTQGNKKSVIIGTIVPEHLKGLSDRGLAGETIYINLHTDKQTRKLRLQTRRKWGFSDEEFVQAQARFAAQPINHPEKIFGHPIPSIDTTSRTPREAA